LSYFFFGLVLSCLFLFGLVLSVWSRLVWSCLILSCLVIYCLVFSLRLTSSPTNTPLLP
jgi:hypothetical protein